MDEWLTLSVGGRTFETTLATLLNAPPPSYFHARFSGAHGPSRDNAAGHHLIDRDAEAFPFILDYLRTLEAFIPP